MFRADTLIRAVLRMDPDTLSDEAWAHQVMMAEWMASYLRHRGADEF